MPACLFLSIVDPRRGIRHAHALPRMLAWVTVAMAVLGSAAARGADPAASERRPDAAQAVQEGNVDQWLQHYQRERGREWERVRERSEQQSPPDAPVEPSPAPASRD